MAKSNLSKSVRKHIVKEKISLKRDNLTREEYAGKMDKLYEAFKKKSKAAVFNSS